MTWLVAWLALNVGFVLGVVWKAWADSKRDEQRRIRLIWLGVKVGMKTGKHVETRHKTRDFIRVADLPGNKVRVN